MFPFRREAGVTGSGTAASLLVEPAICESSEGTEADLTIGNENAEVEVCRSAAVAAAVGSTRAVGIPRADGRIDLSIGESDSEAAVEGLVNFIGMLVDDVVLPSKNA